MLFKKDIQDYLGGSLDPCPKKDVIVNHADEIGLERNKLVHLIYFLGKWFYLFEIEITHVVAINEIKIKIQTDNENGDKKAK